MAGQIPFVLRTRYDDSDSAEKISESLQKTIKNEKYIIICIGTDRSTGDSLGPMVGTILESNGFSAPVYGTLKSPVHAKNIEEIHKTIKQNHVGCKIIAIDACITFNELDIGDISITTDDFPMRPGCGVNKALIPIGDIAIRCNVLKGEEMQITLFVH
jgi:putative sporulation protein YyaC